MYKYKRLQPGQLPRDHLSFSQNLLSYYHKIFETRSRYDLSIFVDERNPCGFSLAEDIKIYQCDVIKR